MDIFNMDDPLGTQYQTPDLGKLKTVGTSKLMVVIFVVDCSRTMEGERINSVNSALQELRFTLEQMKRDNNLDLRIAIMSFASSAKWELNLTPVEEVNIETIRTRPGLTEYGMVFHELNKVLTADGFMKYTGKVAPPAIMFLTDGEPEDDYQPDLDELMKNPWFVNASRSAVLIGDANADGAAREALGKFVVDPKKDIVGTDDSTVIIQKINQATMHVVAGDSMGLSSVKQTETKVTEEEPIVDSLFGEPVEPEVSDNPFGEPASENPFGEPPVDNPFGEPAVDNPFAEPAVDNPFGEPAIDNPFGEPKVENSFKEPDSKNSADPFKSFAPDMDNPFTKKFDDGNDPFALPSEDVAHVEEDITPDPIVTPSAAPIEVVPPQVAAVSNDSWDEVDDPFAGAFSGSNDPFDGII